MFRRKCVLKAPVQKLLKGGSVTSRSEEKVKEEWKIWRKRGEKERAGLKGL